MNRDLIENEIEQLFSNFNEQFTRAKNFKSIPQIEMDLMLATIRNLYEQLYKLNHLTQLPEKTIAVTTSQFVEEKNSNAENLTHAIISETEPIPLSPDVFVQEIKKEEEKIIHHNEQEEVQVATSIKRETVFIEQSKPQSKVVGSLFDEMPTIANNYKEQQSLHHKIGNTKTERLSDKLHQEPVIDLKRAIGINEKFAFMNELFGGNSQQYNQNIETLNGFSNYKEARVYLNQLSSDMSWNTSSKTYHELDELVKRRFDVREI